MMRRCKQSHSTAHLRRLCDSECVGNSRVVATRGSLCVGGWGRGFTLTELMIAIVVLLVVIIATSKIFGTASRITSIGQATASVLQEAAVIERQLREDLERLNHEGVFLIRCVKVRNDINVNSGGPLLNPYLSQDDYIRADQLLFFTHGIESSQTYHISQGSNNKGQGTASRIYYGHSFQLLQGKPFDPGSDRAHDADLVFNPVPDPFPIPTPWHYGVADTVKTYFDYSGGTGTSVFNFTSSDRIDATQPPATEWLLARQQVVLMDDDQNYGNNDSKTIYLGQNLTARSVLLNDPRGESGWFQSREIRNGRCDAAASQMNDIRYSILYDRNTAWGFRPWFDISYSNGDQRDVMRYNLLYYPRAERIAPSMDRVDQALTTSTLGSACSSFIVDWVYEDGAGVEYHDFTVPQHPLWDWEVGLVRIDPAHEQPWFGMYDKARGVFPFGSNPNFTLYTDGPFPWWRAGWTVYPPFGPTDSSSINNVEQYDSPNPNNFVEIYEAFFGYNQSEAIQLDPNEIATYGEPDPQLGYTPWPRAIRITMVLHDTETRLDAGREIQFVLDLPQRAASSSTP